MVLNPKQTTVAYRCPHCGETGNRRWRTPLYLRHNYLLNEKGGARYECVFCNKKSYAAKTKNEPLYKKIIVYIVAIAFLVLIKIYTTKKIGIPGMP